MAIDFGEIGKFASHHAKELEALPKLWQDVKGKDWQDFQERIQTARTQDEAAPEHLQQVEQAGRQAANQGETFPDSLPGLMKTISEHLPKK